VTMRSKIIKRVVIHLRMFIMLNLQLHS